MKNKLLDLNNHLFAQLERLGDEKITTDNLAKEIDRTKAITSVAHAIVSNARLELDAHIAVGEKIVNSLPGMIEAK